MDLPIGEDSEYFERIKVVYGDESERHIVKVLYRARARMDSLLFKDTQLEYVNDSSIEYKASNISMEVSYRVGYFHEGIKKISHSPYIPYNK